MSGTDDPNPYALSRVELEPPAEPGALVPAAPSQRILATIFDWTLYAGLMALSLSATSWGVDLDPFITASIVLTPWVLAALVYLGLLIQRGQTPGKYVFGIRVADLRTGRVPPAYKLVLLRAAPLWVLSCIGPMLIVVELVMLFLPEGRTICDYIAGTRVVVGHPPESGVASV